MNIIRMTILLSCVTFFLTATSLWAVLPLPRTGQEKCYGRLGSGVAQIPCTGTGQDGDIRAGVPWPDPRFTLTYCDPAGPCADQTADCDNNLSTDVITDNLTGLMWARDSNLPVEKLAWEQGLDFARDLNNGAGLCGHRDWRMPNIVELETLTKYATPDSSLAWLKGYGFSFRYYDVDGEFWSSTSVLKTWYPLSGRHIAIHTLRAREGIFLCERGSAVPALWLVRTGFTGAPAPPRRTGQTQCLDPKGNRMRCAGTGQDGETRTGVAWPEPRLTDNGNGTATDNLTGLMWLKDTFTPGPEVCLPHEDKEWLDALDFIKCLNSEHYLGYSDWRLPNIREFFSILDFGNTTPALPNKGHLFSNLGEEDYWRCSSTPAGKKDYWHLVWYTNVGSVGETSKNVPTIGVCPVWPVRAPDFSLCTYSVDSAIKPFPYQGKTTTVQLSASGEIGCPPPMAEASTDWVAVTIEGWAGNKGRARIAVATNPSSLERSADVTIGKEITITVDQAGTPCRIKELVPKSRSFNTSSGSGSFAVKVWPRDCSWAAAEALDWVAVTAGTGIGDGSVDFTVDANPQGRNRTGNITVFLEKDARTRKTFTVKQSK